MQLRMWTYDLAREQTPSLDHLRRLLQTTREGGYNAFGLYMEHRFAYPSMPWAHGEGAVTPEMIAKLENEFRDIQIIPFINLLGHFEGMLYTERGKRYREETLKGMQACPSCPEFVSLAQCLVDDTVAAFSSPLIHIGGDETWQLGKCPQCLARMDGDRGAGILPAVAVHPERGHDASVTGDGKAQIYGEHFGPLAQRVIDAGRRPAVWGDMFLDHPSALDFMPKETLIFDWQYFQSPLETSRSFVEKGFEVVCCPSIQTYNAAWCHLAESEQNVRDAYSAASELNAHGVCVTTWECGLFGNYETILPAIRGACKISTGSLTGSLTGSADTPVGAAYEPPPDKDLAAKIPREIVDRYYRGEITLEEAMRLSKGCADMSVSAPSYVSEYRAESPNAAEWARLMSDGLAACGGPFAHSGTRSGLKCRLLLYANPFLAWLHHHEGLTGEPGDKALKVLDHAMQVAEGPAQRGVTQFVLKAVEFVRLADQARQAYAQELPGVAIASLAPCRQIFEDLEKIAVATQLNIGGSRADIHRCRAARESVERAIRRIKEYGDGSLGYLPAFEVITHPNFIPHDQACWWLINGWARE